jgi:transposase-like protein
MAASVLSAPWFHDEATAYRKLESILWPHGPCCPRCGGLDRITKVNGGRIGLWRCGPCKRQFRVTVGTVFESAHVPLNLWFQAMHMLCSSKKGMSSHQIHRVLSVTYKTAWFMTMRIREAMAPHSDLLAALGGKDKFVEADETFVGGKAANRAYAKELPQKEAVMALVERGGKVRSRHVPNVTATTLRPILADSIAKDTHFRTDQSPVYTEIGKSFASHETVNHSIKEYVRGDAHTNTIEGYFSIFKRGIYGVYHHVSQQHLKRYLAEFDFRYNHRVALGVDDAARTQIALAGIVGKRLLYRDSSVV